MSESKARAAREALTSEPAEVIESEPAAPRLLVIQLKDDGTFEVHNQGVSELESPMLLRLAAKAVEEKHGL